MKKIFSLLIIVAVFCSCESDVKFNDPGFQARKNNFTWRADLATAEFEVTDPVVNTHLGYLTINAYSGLEMVTLKVPFDNTSVITKFNPVVYTLGPTADVSDDITAAYNYEDNGFVLEYSTGQDENGESLGNATITINNFDNVKQTISGTFKFNAKYIGESTVVPDNVNFQEGVFYHVPLE